MNAGIQLGEDNSAVEDRNARIMDWNDGYQAYPRHSYEYTRNNVGYEHPRTFGRLGSDTRRRRFGGWQQGELGAGFIVGVDLVGFREHCELVIFHERDGMTERHLLVIDCKSRMV